MSLISTGGSVIAIKYADGVLFAADTAVFYGNWARHTNVERIHSADKRTVVAFSGDYPDWQSLRRMLDAEHDRDELNNTPMYERPTPKETFSLITRIMYNKRTKMEPIYNSLVIGGLEDGRPFLGTTNVLGTNFEADFFVTSFGNDLCTPVLRRLWRADLTRNEAAELAQQCLRLLARRSCTAITNVQMAVAGANGVEFGEPYRLQMDWSMVQPNVA